MTNSAFSSRRVTGALLGSALSQLVSAGQTYLLVPLFVSAWGSDTYGHWLALTALAAYIGLVDLGGQMCVGNQLATAFAQGRSQSFVELLQRGLSIFGLLAFAGWFVAAAAALTPHTSWDTDSRLVILIYSASVAISVPLGLMNSCYAATGRVVRGQNVANLVRVFTVAMSAGALALHIAPPGYAAIQFACTAAASALVTVDLLRLAPELFKPRFSWRALREAVPLLRDSLPYWVFGLSNTLGVHGVLLAISANSDGQTVATFTTHRAMASLITYVAVMLRPAVWTELTFLAARADYPKLRELVRIIVRTTTWFSTVLACAICLAAPFVYNLWTRSRLHLDVPLMLILTGQAALWAAWVPMSWPQTSAGEPRTLARWWLLNSALTVAGAYVCVRAGWGLRWVAAWSVAMDVACGLIPFPVAAFAFMRGSVRSFAYDVIRAAACSAPFALLAYACASIHGELARFTSFALGAVVLAWPCLRLLYGARDFTRVRTSLLAAVYRPRA